MLLLLLPINNANGYGSIVGLDMVVRDESGNILDTNSTSTTQLYEHHIYAIERIRKATVSIERSEATAPSAPNTNVLSLPRPEFVQQKSHIENDE